jgi:hypothetical protein
LEGVRVSGNRRKHPRLKIHVPVTYALLNGKMDLEPELIGIALDVSLGGILIESTNFVTNEYVVIGFVNIEKMDIKITCKMAYSQKTDGGFVHTGMSFQGTEAEKLEFVTNIIRTYFYREKGLVKNDKIPMPQADSTNGLFDLIYFHDKND